MAVNEVTVLSAANCMVDEVEGDLDPGAGRLAVANTKSLGSATQFTSRAKDIGKRIARHVTGRRPHSAVAALAR